VHNILAELAQGWKTRSLFERQWSIRDFKKVAGMPVEAWLDALYELENALATETPSLSALRQAQDSAIRQTQGGIPDLPLDKLAGYYAHLCDLARGYEKDPVKLEENLRHVQAWQVDVEALEKLLYKE
jgi:hypothetical protein